MRKKIKKSTKLSDAERLERYASRIGRKRSPETRAIMSSAFNKKYKRMPKYATAKFKKALGNAIDSLFIFRRTCEPKLQRSEVYTTLAEFLGMKHTVPFMRVVKPLLIAKGAQPLGVGIAKSFWHIERRTKFD